MSLKENLIEMFVKWHTNSGIQKASLFLRVLFFGFLLIKAFVGSPLLAQETKKYYTSDPTSTSWAKSKNAKSRLLSAYLVAAPKEIKGGIEIVLRQKWKTYWRVPGEAGLPPRFDFTGSENLQKAEVLWPAPNRYIDRYGVAIGYKDRVIFPIKITAKNPKKPVSLKLKLDYAVCEVVCIPLTTNHELSFKLGEPTTSQHLEAIKSFEDQVPIPIEQVKNLEILGIKTGGRGDKAHLVLDMKSKLGFRQPEIFIEGPDALYFRTPKLTGRPSVVSRWQVPISGDIEETPLIGEKIKLTFIDGNRRVEAEYEIKK